MTPYYQDDLVTLYHGDCADWLDAHSTSFDLLLTDPPYGLGISSNPTRQLHAASDWDDTVASSHLISRWVGRCRSSIVWGGNYFDLPPQQKFLVWDKLQPEGLSLAMCEMAWCNLSGPAKMFRQSVLSYRKVHPTEKPEGLMAWCIAMAGRPASLVDPFAGSGTTLAVAKRNGIRCVGIERERAYCDLIVARLSQGSLFGSIDADGPNGDSLRLPRQIELAE